MPETKRSSFEAILDQNELEVLHQIITKAHIKRLTVGVNNAFVNIQNNPPAAPFLRRIFDAQLLEARNSFNNLTSNGVTFVPPEPNITLNTNALWRKRDEIQEYIRNRPIQPASINPMLEKLQELLYSDNPQFEIDYVSIIQPITKLPPGMQNRYFADLAIVIEPDEWEEEILNHFSQAFPQDRIHEIRLIMVKSYIDQYGVSALNSKSNFTSLLQEVINDIEAESYYHPLLAKLLKIVEATDDPDTIDKLKEKIQSAMPKKEQISGLDTRQLIFFSSLLKTFLRTNQLHARSLITRFLSDMDINNEGTVQTIIFLNLLGHLCETYTNSEKLKGFISKYSKTEDKVRCAVFLQKIMKQNHPQFINNILVAIEISPGESNQLNPDPITTAIKDLGALTPETYKAYLAINNEAERTQFANKVKKLRASFFKNISLTKLLKDGTNSMPEPVLREIVYLAYSPQRFGGISEVLTLIDDKIDDCTGHLYEYVLNSKDTPGVEYWEQPRYYELNVSLRKVASNKSGKNKSPLERAINNMASIKPEHAERMHLIFAEQIVRVMSDEVEDGLPDAKEPLDKLRKLSILLLPMRTMQGRDNGLGELSTDQQLVGQLKVELEHEFDTHFAEAFKRLLEDSGFQQSLRETSQANNEKTEIYVDFLDKFIDTENGVDKAIEEAKNAIREKYISIVLKYLDDQPKQLNGEDNLDQQSASSQRLRLYIGKSEAFFFSGASAGLCTAEDVDYFNEEGHFDFPIVDEDNVVVGLVKILVAEIGGKKVMVLRQPTRRNDMRGRYDAKSWVQEIFSAMSTFLKANPSMFGDLEYIYLPEDTSWHELSNDPEVLSILKAECKPGNKVHAQFDIPFSSKHTGRVFYKKKVA